MRLLNKDLFIGLIVSYNIITTNEWVMIMFDIRYVRGQIHVYNANGDFLFSADNEREVREELKEYAQSAA